MNAEPARIVVHLSALQLDEGIDAEIVRTRVDATLRKAYPRASVTVALRQLVVGGARVTFPGEEPSPTHAAAIERLVDFVVARASRFAAVDGAAMASLPLE
jgi:hypothetical protein